MGTRSGVLLEGPEGAVLGSSDGVPLCSGGRWLITRKYPVCMQTASHRGFTSRFDSAAAVGSVGAEGGAGSDDWEGLKGNQRSGKTSALYTNPSIPSDQVRQ